MAQVWRGWYGSLGTAALAMGWAALASGGCVNAQVIPDATLGGENSTVTSTGSVDQITGGATRGPNLFHSFEQFGVDAGRGAYFTNPAGIENILSRVTGGSASNILGTLGVTGGNANLFLLNPNGIFFGPNASLDVGGSFVATTANAIQFGGQGLFSSSVANTPPVLAVNPSAFLFNQIAASSITNHSTAGLQVPAGESLLLVGGDVSLDGGRLLAPGGRVELGGAVASSGTIGLSVAGDTLGLRFPDNVARADVSLTKEAVVDVTAGGGGSIAISARDLDVSGGSRLVAGIGSGLGSVGSQAGDITLDATGTITVAGGTGGPVPLFSGVFNRVGVRLTERGMGNAGDINITAGSFSATNGASLGTTTDGQGNAGNVTINARDTVSLVGDADGRGGVFSNIGITNVGNGGDISITTGSFSATNGARLSATNAGRGDAGNVTINARDAVSFDGIVRGVERGDRSSSVLSTVESSAKGNGGDINIMAGLLSLTNGAQLSASAFGVGDAGDLQVVALSLALNSQAALTAESASGQGGNIALQSQDLILRGNSTISAISGSEGRGGSAGNISIDTDLFVAIEDSDIVASSLGGPGANVQINSLGFLRSPDSQITVNGREVNTQDVDLQSFLTQLSANFVSPDQAVAGSCLAKRNAERGSFTVTGTGGLPRSPYEAISGHYNVTDVQPIQESGPASIQPAVVKIASWKRGDPIQEAQGLFVTADGRTIVGTAPQLATVAKAQDLVCSG